MAINYGKQILFVVSDPNNSNMKMYLGVSGGDVLCYYLYYSVEDYTPLGLDTIINALYAQLARPIIRISVLNADETLNYTIPLEHIVLDGVSYNENYTNGQRRNLSLKLINVKELSADGTKMTYKYLPHIDGLWYGTKIKYEQGVEYQGKEYYFSKGIYIIDNFDMQHTSSARDITYQCTDKFGYFEGATGILEQGYEIPVDTPIDEVIEGLLNLSCADGRVVDIKTCIIDSKYIDFKTQSTIRVGAGGTIGNLIEQLATQMSAEYYYNAVGNLVLYPVDESMNDVNKPIVWVYDENQMDGLSFQGDKDIVNVVQVTGNNIDGQIYSGVAKNTNLNSPINIYRIKERKMMPIDTANVWSDEMAEELAQYHLRKKSILNMKQQCSVPYNPFLMVNNLIEIENKDLDMKRSKYIINSISYTSGSPTMQIEISNITNLPFIGGIKYDGQ